MKAYRSTTLMGASMALAGAAATLGLAASPAMAQVSNDIVINIMRECAKIDDPSARLACYDNNIRSGGSDGGNPVVPGQFGRVQGGGAANQAQPGNGAGGFGAEDIQTPQRFEAPVGEVSQIRARVANISQRQPNTYLVTLEDGARWLYTESAPRSHRPPSKGSTVEIQRASLGGFLLVSDGQAAVRVRRVK